MGVLTDALGEITRRHLSLILWRAAPANLGRENVHEVNLGSEELLIAQSNPQDAL